MHPKLFKKPNVGPKTKKQKKKKIGACSLIHNILKARRRVGALGWD
jgi:hypothetical protein